MLNQATPEAILFESVSDGMAAYYSENLAREVMDTSIRDILLNEKYTGTYVYNRRSSKRDNGKRNNSTEKDPDQIIRIENAFSAIIDMEIFTKVKKLMDSRRSRNACNQAQEVYLLSGIIRCGICGSNMHGNRKRTNRDKSFHITYKCNKRDKLGKKICDCKEINKQYIEKTIMHYISKCAKVIILTYNESFKRL